MILLLLSSLLCFLALAAREEELFARLGAGDRALTSAEQMEWTHHHLHHVEQSQKPCELTPEELVLYAAVRRSAQHRVESQVSSVPSLFLKSRKWEGGALVWVVEDMR